MNCEIEFLKVAIYLHLVKSSVESYVKDEVELDLL